MIDWNKKLRGKTNVVCRKKGRSLVARKQKGDILWSVHETTTGRGRRCKVLGRDLSDMIVRGEYETHTIT